MTSINRNDKCPCGSGKKYKQCCLQKNALRDAEMAQRGIEFRSALTHYQSGRFIESETILNNILQLTPDYPDALYLLGMRAHETGKNELAVEFIKKAITGSPSNREFYRNLGVILERLGRFEEALQNYRHSLNFNRNWHAELLGLTIPLVLTTGLKLGSKNTIKYPPNSKTVPLMRENEEQPNLSVNSLAELSGFESTAVGSIKEAAGKKLRIVLIYPPPWEIHSSRYALLGMPYGAPLEREDQSFAGDFQSITYGLLTIAAQAKRAGHDVTVYNLSTCLWRDIVKLISEIDADVYGLSAFTANRRGMGAVAALIRQCHPQAHITVGGPFVTALPQETLRHYRDIDTAVIGEGEDTFMALLECLGSGRPPEGIPGTAWRNGKEINVGPIRPRIDHLDDLASPFDYYTNDIVMTSRGCPSKCTFCGSFTTWGRKLRFHSAAVCLDMIRKALDRLPVPFIAFKDDTFTADRRRVMAICEGIIKEKINFMWSCDTRVDCLDDELLFKMRQAGCQMISFGVESGAPEILKSIRKEATPEMVLKATNSAKKYGIDVRYYMILLSRGETIETVQQSNDLIKAGRPSQYVISPMTYVPGTEDWEILSEKQGLTADIFFQNDFKELSSITNRQIEFLDFYLRSICDIGTINGFEYKVEEREAIANRLPDVAGVHVELANAYLRAGRFVEALSELDRADELDFPIVNIIYNQRACIALATGEIENAHMLLERAIQNYSHPLVKNNIEKLQAWIDAPKNDRGQIPLLKDSVLALDFRSQVSHSDRTTAI